MWKILAVVAALSACGGSAGDTCEKAYEKTKTLMEKDMGKKPDKQHEVDSCKDMLKKHPERQASMECVIAIKGEPTMEDIMACGKAAKEREKDKGLSGDFADYQKKSKMTEAKLQLNRLGKDAKVAFISNGAFPIGHGDAEGTCCGQPNNKCPVSATLWTLEPWKTLDFSIDEPHLYRYSYDSKDGKSFVATAVGDLDCDGTEATYTATGTSVDGNPKVEIVDPPAGAD